MYTISIMTNKNVCVILTAVRNNEDSKVHREEVKQMNTAKVFVYLKNERCFDQALYSEQGLHFAYTFWIGRKLRLL